MLTSTYGTKTYVDFACVCGAVFRIEAKAEDGDAKRDTRARNLLGRFGHRVADCLGEATPVLPPGAEFPCTCGRRVDDPSRVPSTCACGGLELRHDNRWCVAVPKYLRADAPGMQTIRPMGAFVHVFEWELSPPPQPATVATTAAAAAATAGPPPPLLYGEGVSGC